MKRSMQEVVELVVFALIALLVGTGVVWLVGWVLGLAGLALTWLAGLVWSLLRFLVPIALVAGAVYLLVRLMNRSASKVAGEPQKQPATPPSPQTAAREAAAREAAAGEQAAAGTSAAAGAAADAQATDVAEATAGHETDSDADEPKRSASEAWADDGGSGDATASGADSHGTEDASDASSHRSDRSDSDESDSSDEDDRKST